MGAISREAKHDDAQAVAKVCGIDRNSSVLADAWVEWDAKLATWEIVAVFDNSLCAQCGAQNSLTE